MSQAFDSRPHEPILRGALHRRAEEFGAMALAFAALALLVALVSYNSHDPSLNTATGEKVSNLAGAARGHRRRPASARLWPRRSVAGPGAAGLGVANRPASRPHRGTSADRGLASRHAGAGCRSVVDPSQSRASRRLAGHRRTGRRGRPRRGRNWRWGWAATCWARWAPG